MLTLRRPELLALIFVFVSCFLICPTGSFAFPPLLGVPLPRRDIIMLRNILPASLAGVSFRGTRCLSTIAGSEGGASRSDPASRKVVILTGPTAVGKTSCTYALCSSLGSRSIISADSVQIYKELTVGANKPTAEELREHSHIKHHLLSEVDLYSPKCNAKEWFETTINLIQTHFEDQHASSSSSSSSASSASSSPTSPTKAPIIVSGGTMMYLDWLLHGCPSSPGRVPSLDGSVSRVLSAALASSSAAPTLAPTPPMWSVAIERLTAFLEKRRCKSAYAEDGFDTSGFDALSDLSPSQSSDLVSRMHALSPNDLYRLRRLIEISLTSSSASNPGAGVDAPSLLTSSRRLPHPLQQPHEYDMRPIFLCPSSRTEHARLIDLRCVSMLKAGLLPEVGSLLQSHPDLFNPYKSGLLPPSPPPPLTSAATPYPARSVTVR